jgi:hypothetical protein
MLHRLIRCKLPVLLHPKAFKRFCIPNLSHSNHNFKVFVVLHLSLHIERDGPHIPCSHAKKLKSVAKVGLIKLGVLKIDA